MPSPATSLLDSNMSIKQEPCDNTISPLAMFEELDSKPTPLPTLDVTQHSAEMLCDLPCPSSLRSARTTTLLPPALASRTLTRQSSTSLACHAWWARLFLYLIHLHTQTAYRQILLGIWSISPSRMQALITRAAASTRTPSTTMLSSSTTSSTQTPLRLLRSTQLLAQRNAATSREPLARRSVVERRSSTASGVIAEDGPRSAERGHDTVRNVSQGNGVSEDT